MRTRNASLAERLATVASVQPTRRSAAALATSIASHATGGNQTSQSGIAFPPRNSRRARERWCGK
jgi:hypothetical protein